MEDKIALYFGDYLAAGLGHLCQIHHGAVKTGAEGKVGTGGVVGIWLVWLVDIVGEPVVLKGVNGVAGGDTALVDDGLLKKHLIGGEWVAQVFGAVDAVAAGAGLEIAADARDTDAHAFVQGGLLIGADDALGPRDLTVLVVNGDGHPVVLFSGIVEGLGDLGWGRGSWQ